MSHDTMKTPQGFVMPQALYAAWIAVCITLGSAIMMYSLELPWWSWVAMFIVLFPVTYALTGLSTATAKEGSHRVVVHRKGLIVFALVTAVLLGAVIVMALT